MWAYVSCILHISCTTATDRDRSTGYSQDQSTRKGNQEWHCPRRQELQHARSCDEVYLASLTWICDADRLYTDAALVLDASTSVVAAAGSGLIFTYLLQDSHATAAHEHRLCLCKTM